MINKNKKRIMITLTAKDIQNLEEIKIKTKALTGLELTLSQIIATCIKKEHDQ